MNRGKHLVLLISSILFVAICFIVMNLSSDLKNYEEYEIDITNTFTIDSFAMECKPTAEMFLDFNNDEIVINITKKGENYDDAGFSFSLPEINYDIENVKQILGNQANENEQYLQALENGPWNGKILFMVSAKNNENAKLNYTVQYDNDKESAFRVTKNDSQKFEETESIKITKNDNGKIRFIFGSKFGGALEEGEYSLKVKVVLTSIYKENDSTESEPVLSIIDKVKIFFNRIINSFKDKGIKGLIQIDNIGLLYKTILIVGLIYFLWVDIRTAYQLGKIIDIYDLREGLYIFKDVILNGQYAGDQGDGSFNKPIIAILVMIVSYAILVVTLPLRVIILIVKDIIGLIIGSEGVEKVPVFGNLLGSLGTYFVILGIYLMFVLTFWIGAIFVVIGALLIFFGHKVTKNNAYLW